MFRSITVVYALPIVYVLAMFGLLTPVGADPSATAAVDPQAMAALMQVQKTMLGLRSYQAECDTTTSYPTKADKPAHIRRQTSLLKAIKPNRMWYVQRTLKQDAATRRWTPDPKDAGIIFVCNGKLNWQQFGASYRVSQNTGPEYMHTILEPWGGFYHAGDSPAAWVQYCQKDGDLLELRRDGQESVGGVLCDKVFDHLRTQYGGETQEYWETWYIGGDNLVRRQVQRIEFGGKPGFTRDATLRRIVVNQPAPAKTFAYIPAPGVKSEAQQQADQPKLLTVGTAAPDFTASDTENKPIKPSDLRGKVVVLDFWASWCPPCRASMPHSQQVTQKLQAEGLPVVLLAVDNSEDRDAFTTWVSKNGATYSALTFAHIPPATDVLGKFYHVSGIPTQYVLDKNGVVRASFVGYGGPTDDLENAVRSALKQP